MQGMPKPGPGHEKLEMFLGKWMAEEKLSPTPWGPGGTATGHMTARMDLEGFFLVQDYVEEKDGKITYRGHGVFGYDEQKDEYSWFWFDSMGAPPSGGSRGRWIGDTLVLEHHLPEGHGRYTYRFQGDGQYHFQIENSQDGVSYQQFMEATYRRVATL